MRIRFRLLAALLALFAFSVSVAEQAWAATCAPGVPEAPATASANADHSGHASAEPSRPAEETHHGSAPGHRECPVAAATQAGCTVPALPGAGVEVEAPPLAASSESPAPDAEHGLLLASPFFRPPQR